MFICEDCLTKDDVVSGMFRIYGPCEVCGHYRKCYDVNIHPSSENKNG